MASETIPDSWQFYMPLRKAAGMESEHGAPLWTVDGIAASQHQDRQQETLFMKGMDYAPYLAEGIINWNHDGSPMAIIGAPIEGRTVEYQGQPAFYTKGFLYQHQPYAQAVWQHLEGLEKGHYPVARGIGWSVQGRTLERAGRQLLKSVVQHCAITHEPVNGVTFAHLVKSLLLGESTAIPAFGVTTATLQPLMVQNIAGGAAPGALPATWGDLSWLEEDCPTHTEPRGGWRDGLHGLLDHLVKCRGVAVADATRLVTSLAAAGGTS